MVKYIRLVAGLCLAATIVIGGVSLVKIVGESSFQSYIVVVGTFFGCYLAVCFALKDIPKFDKGRKK